MLSYPIVIPMPRSRLPLDWHPDAASPKVRKQLEDYLNEVAKKTTGKTLIYPEIAAATGIPKEIVMFFLKPLEGSYGGITVRNPELDKGKDT